ncbi:MAG: DotU family type IV/VI secretion system protein [Candidatus Electrothrix sp. EH2]|nr:DotU family type IV/VI secretion system protein [Candidatus Electrothrix sp. EH2]
MRLVDCFCDLFAFVLRLSENAAQYSDARQVHEHCLGLVEEVRECGRKRGYDQPRFEEALFAVIVWMDEAILCADLPFTADWSNYLLQRHLFQTNNGGDEFYDRLETADRQDEQLLEVFAYCFALGFCGRLYGDTDSLEEQHAALYSRLHNGSSPSKKLFPSGYCSSERHGYKPPKVYMLRSLALFLVPLSLLIAVYCLCFFRLDMQMRGILGGG